MNDITDVKEQFKKRFSELRYETGLSQVKLGKLLKLSPATIGYYENGDRVPDIVTAARIANYFSVSVDYLLGLSDVRSTEQNIKNICKATGLSENAVDGLISAAEWGEPALTKTINLLLSELASDLNCVDKIERGIVAQLKTYLFTTNNDNRTYSVSYSGKLINLSNTDAFAKPEIETVEDFLSCCRIEANEIIEKVLFERLCDTIKKTKNNLKEFQTNNFVFDVHKKNTVDTFIDNCTIEQEDNCNGKHNSKEE